MVRFAAPGKFGPFVDQVAPDVPTGHTIARRVAADHVRRAGRRPRVAVLPDWQQTADVVAPQGSHRFDEHHALTDLPERLDPQRREAFLLTQLADLSYAEAAEACGCPVGTIRSRVARAREDLISALDAVHPQPRTAAG